MDQLDLGLDFYVGVFPDTPRQELTRSVLPLHYGSLFEQGDLETLQMLRAIRDNISLREVGHLSTMNFY